MTTTETVDTRLVTDEREIRQLTDLLFVYTDLKDWSAACNLYVDDSIEVDMSFCCTYCIGWHTCAFGRLSDSSTLR